PHASSTKTPATADQPPETLPPPPPIAYTRDEPGIIVGQVLGADGRGLADAVAWLEQGKPTTAPGQELQLIQKEGAFRPRVQAARVGSRLKLLCAEEQASFKASGAADFNLRLTQGRQQVRPLERAGLIEVRSELKPEQSAYVWVFDHPYFALTDATGRFRLPMVEPGSYTLVLWQASRAPQRKQWPITLQPGWGAEVDWKLAE
ncbi:MAG: hypothetical protein JNM56_17635, partial [Planctomycetia bacterium]|nr:hypothetical protein [Planctomycetia bacterium]